MSSITMYRERNSLAGSARPELFLTVPESTKAETADFPSFKKIALAELRRSCPELKKRNLLVWDYQREPPVDAINALLARRYCGVSPHFAKPDSKKARALSCAEEVKELAEWRVEIIGDSLFRYELDTRRPSLIMMPRGVTGISSQSIFDGLVEIRRQGEKERLWLAAIARSGENMCGEAHCFLIHEPDGHGLRDAYLSLCGKVHDFIMGFGAANDTIIVLNSLGEALHFGNQNWDDIYMTPEVRRGVREDFQFFIKSEGWFRKRHLTFKRGYLLAGPPGNGKTTTIRAMAGTQGFSAFTFDFTRQNNNSNSDLMNAFKIASKSAPCIFLLEDIDRIFCEREEKQKQVLVTRDGLLNCLDGVSQNDGMVVVATANHPEDLDEAILRRPGRFDRVVRFDPPDCSMRLRILNDLFDEEEEVKTESSFLPGLAEATDGFSMASMKELYIASANEAFQEGCEISKAHALRALDLMRGQYKMAAAGRKVGFGR